MSLDEIAKDEIASNLYLWDISGEVVSLASFGFRGYCSVNDFPKKNHDKTEFRKCSLYLREVITKR